MIPVVLAVPAAATALAGGDSMLSRRGRRVVLAVGLYAFARVSGLGTTAQAWDRGEAGAAYRATYRTAPPLRFLVPDAMVPGILRTGEVFGVGSVLSIVGEAIGSGWATLVAPLALLAVAAVLTARLRPTFDRAFWTSHGVWADAFRQVEFVEGREPIQQDAVYWAPRALRPTVWAGLVSLDRRLPLGRFAALGLGIAVVVHLAASAEVGMAALALTVLGLNGAVALTATEAVILPAAAHRLGGAGRWTAARFLMNLRWLPPVVAALLVLVWLGGLPWRAVLGWTVVDLTVAALSAVLVTLASRTRFRRALA